MRVGLFYVDEVGLSADVQTAFQNISNDFATAMGQLLYPSATWVILSGLAATAHGTADNGINISSGVAVQNGFIIAPTAFGVNILPGSYPYGTGLAADPTNPRWDTVAIQYATSPGNLQSRNFNPPATSPQNVNVTQSDSFVIDVVHGTPAGSPTKPSAPAGYNILAYVYVPANSTTVTSGNVYDQSALNTVSGGRLSAASGGILSRNDAASTPTMNTSSGITLNLGTSGAKLYDNTGAGYLDIYGNTTNGIRFQNNVAFNGNVVLPNTDHVYVQDASAVNRNAVYMDATNIMHFGDSNDVAHFDASSNTVSGLTTFESGVYFAGGSTYYIDASGNATFNTITSTGDLTIDTRIIGALGATKDIRLVPGATLGYLDFRNSADTASSFFVNVNGGQFNVPLTMNATMYFANGTTYYVDATGKAVVHGVSSDADVSCGTNYAFRDATGAALIDRNNSTNKIQVGSGNVNDFVTFAVGGTEKAQITTAGMLLLESNGIQLPNNQNLTSLNAAASSNYNLAYASGANVAVYGSTGWSGMLYQSGAWHDFNLASNGYLRFVYGAGPVNFIESLNSAESASQDLVLSGASGTNMGNLYLYAATTRVAGNMNIANNEAIYGVTTGGGTYRLTGIDNSNNIYIGDPSTITYYVASGNYFTNAIKEVGGTVTAGSFGVAPILATTGTTGVSIGTSGGTALSYTPASNMLIAVDFYINVGYTGSVTFAAYIGYEDAATSTGQNAYLSALNVTQATQQVLHNISPYSLYAGNTALVYAKAGTAVNLGIVAAGSTGGSAVVWATFRQLG